MVDSDDDYVEASSGDESAHNMRATGSAKAKSKGVVSTRSSSKKGSAPPPKERWEEIHRSWDNVVEIDGSLSSTIIGLLEATKRKRLLRDATPFQRGIIRHMVLVLDASAAMGEKDFRPNRWLVTCRYVVEFIKEYFEQNPISQLAIIGMRDGVAMRVSDMSGSVNEHINAVNGKLRVLEPKGVASLQNALDMARGELWHAKSYGTREVLIVFGALSSCDPGDLHETIGKCVEEKLQIRVAGLAAQVAVCKEMCNRTNKGDDHAYGVAMHEQHFRELLLEATVPPVARSQKSHTASLLMMGFPSRSMETADSLCACHGKPTRGGYLCSRCNSKVCQLPTECPTCNLTLILSTHLARSYHHLFPLINWVEVLVKDAHKSTHCFGCQVSFPWVDPLSRSNNYGATDGQKEEVSTQRYECPKCKKHFCVDCDVFCHENVYNCPGCLCAGTMAPPEMQRMESLLKGKEAVKGLTVREKDA